MKKAALKEFVNLLMPKIEVLAGDDYEVFTHEVTKPNDLKLVAISVRKTDANVSRNVYVEPYYQQFASGECSIDELAKTIFDAAVNVELEVCDCEDIVHHLTDYEVMRKRIIIKLLNGDANEEYLRGKCYMPLFDTDIQIVFYVLVETQEDSIGTIVVSQECFESWHVSMDELYKEALHNTQEQFAPVIKSLFAVVEELRGKTNDPFFDMMNPPELDESETAYVVTNEAGVNGAAALIYPELLSGLAEKIGVDKLIILPSSIHEGIILPYADNCDMEDCRKMVREVNATAVLPSEALSNNVFLYDAEDDTIRIWTEE